MPDRQCVVCSAVKAVEDFKKDVRGPLGYSGVCKKCTAEQLRKWRAAHPAKFAEYQKTYFSRDPERHKRYVAWRKDYYARWNGNHRPERKEYGRRAWAKLKERLKLDPSLAAVREAYNRAYSKAWRAHPDTARVVANWHMREFIPPSFPNFYPLIVGELSEDHPIMRALADCTREISEEVRDDVRQELLVAVLTGVIQTADLRKGSPALKTAVTEAWRTNPSRFGPISLDAPTPWSEDGELTLLDRLASVEEIW